MFDVEIPQAYAVVTEKGKLAGKLDGRPYTGGIWLGKGAHEFRREGGAGRMAIFLNDAYAKGFRPLFDAAEFIVKDVGTEPPGREGREPELQ